MKETWTSRGVFWFTVVTVFFSFCLIGLGGLVTSKEAGLTVHDWPTSLGNHMFLLPFDLWVGRDNWGVFLEHSHRLLASIVGLLTAGLTSWFWIREAKGVTRIIALVGTVIPLGLLGVRTEEMFVIMAIAAVLMIVFSAYKILKNRNAKRWWATMAYSMVIVQGVLGGYRVLVHYVDLRPNLANQIGIFHGTLAQVFLIVLALIALFSSNWWRKARVASNPNEQVPRVVRAHFLYATILVLLQLVIGATMRHQHNGLAVWDFPKAHGQWWPSTDASSMKKYSAERSELSELKDKQKETDYLNPRRDEIEPKQVTLHMVHRLIAVLIFGLVFGTIMLARKKLGGGHLLTKLALFWLGLVLVQILLGALTVLKHKPADIATMHVLFGSLTLITGTLGAVICRNLHLPSLNEDSNGRDARKIEQVETTG